MLPEREKLSITILQVDRRPVLCSAASSDAANLYATHQEKARKRDGPFGFAQFFKVSHIITRTPNPGSFASVLGLAPVAVALGYHPIPRSRQLTLGCLAEHSQHSQHSQHSAVSLPTAWGS